MKIVLFVGYLVGCIAVLNAAPPGRSRPVPRTGALDNYIKVKVPIMVPKNPINTNDLNMDHYSGQHMPWNTNHFIPTTPKPILEAYARVATYSYLLDNMIKS